MGRTTSCKRLVAAAMLGAICLLPPGGCEAKISRHRDSLGTFIESVCDLGGCDVAVRRQGLAEHLILGGLGAADDVTLVMGRGGKQATIKLGGGRGDHGRLRFKLNKGQLRLAFDADWLRIDIKAKRHGGKGKGKGKDKHEAARSYSVPRHILNEWREVLEEE